MGRPISASAAGASQALARGQPRHSRTRATNASAPISAAHDQADEERPGRVLERAPQRRDREKDARRGEGQGARAEQHAPGRRAGRTPRRRQADAATRDQPDGGDRSGGHEQHVDQRCARAAAPMLASDRGGPWPRKPRQGRPVVVREDLLVARQEGVVGELAGQRRAEGRQVAQPPRRGHERGHDGCASDPTRAARRPTGWRGTRQPRRRGPARPPPCAPGRRGQGRRRRATSAAPLPPTARGHEQAGGDARPRRRAASSRAPRRPAGAAPRRPSARRRRTVTDRGAALRQVETSARHRARPATRAAPAVRRGTRSRAARRRRSCPERPSAARRRTTPSAATARTPAAAATSGGVA